MEDTVRGTRYSVGAEKQSGIRSTRYGTTTSADARRARARPEESEASKERTDEKCSLETLSTLHADGHRFGKTKWRVVAKGRMKR